MRAHTKLSIIRVLVRLQMLRTIFITLISLYVVPVLVSAAIYRFRSRGRSLDWQSADRSSAGLLPVSREMPQSFVGIFSARTVRWRSIVATHSWIVIKDAGAAAYERFDYTAWGQPISKDRFVADGRWFGSMPEIIFAAEGGEAAGMIPTIRKTIRDYRYPRPGDYRLWPGPNSNTFVATIMQAVPIRASLPATAIGKDFPYDGRWAGLTPSKTGIRLNVRGYFGLTIGWYEGIELNFLGAVAGVDIRRPALKLPGLGRLGVPANPVCSITFRHPRPDTC